MPFHRERIGVGAARLLRQEHGEAAIVGRAGIGAHQQRHHVGARRVGDPGLVAGHLVDIAVLDRAGLQRAEIGAGVGLGEHRRRQDLAARQLGQPIVLLLLGAAEADQLRRDLRARAERAEPDIAARQFLGHHAHRELAEAGAAELLRHGQAEHAHLRQLSDDLERDQLVLQMPAMRILAVILGEAAELVAHHQQRIVVEAGLAEFALRNQFGQAAREAPAGPPAGTCSRCPTASADRSHRGRGRSAARSRPGSSECRRRSAPGTRRSRVAGSTARARRACPSRRAWRPSSRVARSAAT